MQKKKNINNKLKDVAHDITQKASVKLMIFFSFIYLTVSMEFFDDITIPYEYLQQPSKLYPLSIIYFGISYHQLYDAPHTCHQIIFQNVLVLFGGHMGI